MELMVAIYLVVFIAALFQSSVGFGANLIAMPIVVQLDPDLVPGAVLLANTVISTFVVIRDHSGIRWRLVVSATSGAIAGATLGAFVLRHLSSDGLGVVVALCVLGAVALSLIRRSPARSVPNMMAAGAASGFSGSTAGIAGPPIALLFAGAPPNEFRGTLGLFFVTTSATSFTALHLAGRFGADQLAAGLLLTPATLCAFVLSRPLLRYVDVAMIRPAVFGVSTASAVVLLARLVI